MTDILKSDDPDAILPSLVVLNLAGLQIEEFGVQNLAENFPNIHMLNISNGLIREVASLSALNELKEVYYKRKKADFFFSLLSLLNLI